MGKSEPAFGRPAEGIEGTQSDLPLERFDRWSWPIRKAMEPAAKIPRHKGVRIEREGPLNGV
jgi:hypothetical protein